jgi:hypothetical protein
VANVFSEAPGNLHCASCSTCDRAKGQAILCEGNCGITKHQMCWRTDGQGRLASVKYRHVCSQCSSEQGRILAEPGPLPMDQCHVCVGSNWCECGCSQSPFILKQQLEPGLGNDVSGNLKFVPLAADADGLSQRTVNRKMGRVLQMRRAKYARHVDFFHVVSLETVAHLQGAFSCRVFRNCRPAG